MKKRLALVMAAVLALGLAACAKPAAPAATTAAPAATQAATQAAAPAATQAAAPAETTAAPAETKASKGGTRYISIGTSSAGGTFSIIGTAIADVLNRNIPDVSANIEITGGSGENLLLAEQGTVELAMSASDVLYNAINGTKSFEGKQIHNVQWLMGGHLTTTQLYVLKDSPYYTLDDLKGKKIATGPSGSVGLDAMNLLMSKHGYEMNKDWTPELLAHGDGAEALVDGNVDAVMIMSTVPCGPITTAASSKEIRIIQIDDETLNAILEECPYYVQGTVPANTYNGQTEEIKSFSSASFLCCNKDLDEDLAYNAVKYICENTDTLVNAYAQCAEWIPENAYRGMSGVEMHPGAKRYFDEIGIKQP